MLESPASKLKADFWNYLFNEKMDAIQDMADYAKAASFTNFTANYQMDPVVMESKTAEIVAMIQAVFEVPDDLLEAKAASLSNLAKWTAHNFALNVFTNTAKMDKDLLEILGVSVD